MKPVNVLSNTLVPFQDEDGVMIGTCLNCNIEFAINVTNPDFSTFKSGALLIDHFFNEDGKDKNGIYKKDKYQNHQHAIERVEGDDDLSNYSTSYIYDEYPLYICKHCGENLETLAYQKFCDKFEQLKNTLQSYISAMLKNGHGDNPEYIIARVYFSCSCKREHQSLFFKRYRETVDIKASEFSICNVKGSLSVGDRIKPGVYTKTNIISWLYKLIPRWTILFDKIYIITPFVGHQYKSSAETVELWIKLLNRLDPKKSIIKIRSNEMGKFKAAYSKVNNIDYDELENYQLGSDLISNAIVSDDFHAKIYCGVSQYRCEILSGSPNFVNGPSKEVVHFNMFSDFSTVNDSFLKPLGISETFEKKTNARSLLFNSDNNFNTLMEISSSEYGWLIIGDECDK